MPRHKLHIAPQNRSGVFEEGTLIRDAALQLGVLIESSCAGFGTCGQCKVHLTGQIRPPGTREFVLLSDAERSEGYRLACQARLAGDVKCVVPSTLQTSTHQILVDAAEKETLLAPDLVKVYLEMPKPALGKPHFDFEHVLDVLREGGYPVSNFALEVVQVLPDRLQQGQGITAVLDQTTLLTVEAGDTTGQCYGVALDLGTTTLAAKLINLHSGEVCAVVSALNPQAMYGADVVTRLHHIMDQPEGLEQLHTAIIEAVNTMLGQMAEAVRINLSHIYKVVLAGNTVMQHIALGIDPRQMGQKPYTPAFKGPATVATSALGLDLNGSGVLYSMPNLASFVGGDISAGLAALNLDESDEIQLLVDMGTNGELVLGTHERLVCGSSPVGPAWEGGCISSGMRAANGAIERVEIEAGEVQCQTIGEEPPIGICGSGLVDAICAFLHVGLIAPSGRIMPPVEVGASLERGLYNRFKELEGGERVLVLHDGVAGRPITLTQADVRAVQLAKAAIAAGIVLLMKELGIEARHIAHVYMAGAFGNHLRGQDVVALGLVPDVAPEKISFIGNAALSGAEAVLRSRHVRKKAERIARRMTYIELADRPDFQETFVEKMTFPTPWSTVPKS